MNDEKLIECVRSFPCLFDKSNKDFKDREKKRRAWMEIAKSLEVDETIATKRWGNLRERFSKEVRNLQKSSGSGASVGRQWVLLENMQFLRGHIIPRPMRQSAPINDEKQSAPINEDRFEFDLSGDVFNNCDESPSQTAISPVSISPAPSSIELRSNPPAQTVQPTLPTRKRRAAQLDEVDTAILDTIKTFKEVCARKVLQEEVDSGISGFGKMICSAISKMSKTKQALVMQRCTEIVMQAQIDENEK